MTPTSSPTPAKRDETAGPSTVWLGAGFLLAGLGTVLLGPILPSVSARWHLSDAQAGSLLFAKFLGAFAGGSTVPRRLRFGILLGLLCTAAGLSGFALASNLWLALPALLLTGFGLGQLIASSNILAGHRYAAHTGSALSTLNFFWSLGAVSTGLLTAWLLPEVHLPVLLFSAATAFLLAGFGGALAWVSPPYQPATGAPENAGELPVRVLVFFAGLLLLYGGLETSLSSWLPTFEKRYIGTQLVGGQSALVLLWSALTAGRALAVLALRRWPERMVLRCSLAASVILVGALAGARTAKSLSAVCLLLGLSLAPWFPATFALLLRYRPEPRKAGFVLAVSGIGAAVFPWLTGILSTRMGSLRMGLTVPAVLALLLLFASFRHKQTA